MNTIAVLTDLSAETANACFYALKLAVRMKANVQLFNVSITNKIQQSVLVAVGGEVDTECDEEAAANEFCKSVYTDFEYRCFTGTFRPVLSCQAVKQSAADALMSFMEGDDVSLIIVPLSEGQTVTAFGQSAALKNIMDMATVPVLVVPGNVDTQYFEKVAFCVGGEAHDVQNILALIDLMKPLLPEIMVANLTLRDAVDATGNTLMQAVKAQTDYGRIYYRDIMPADHKGKWK